MLCAAKAIFTITCHRCVLSWYLKIFWGIPACLQEYQFLLILGMQSKMELLYQKKEFVEGCISGNEQLGNNS